MSNEWDNCGEHSLECSCYEKCKCGKHPATNPDEFNMLIAERGMFDTVLEKEIDATCKTCNDRFYFNSKNLLRQRPFDYKMTPYEG